MSNAERDAIAEALDWLERNRAISHETVLADLGLTSNDWEKMADEPLPGEAPALMAKRVVWTEQARSDVRGIERQTAWQILTGELRGFFQAIKPSKLDSEKALLWL